MVSRLRGERLNCLPSNPAPYVQGPKPLALAHYLIKRIITFACAGIVSGQNRRYRQDGYDLDLAYVTDNIIAMSYPFEGLKGQRSLYPLSNASRTFLHCVHDHACKVLPLNNPLPTACFGAEFYRNPLSRVRKFLDNKHEGHYKLFNLCSERFYNASKFGDETEVACFPFEDHQVCKPSSR